MSRPAGGVGAAAVQGSWPLSLRAALEFLAAVRRFLDILVLGGWRRSFCFECGRRDCRAALQPVFMVVMAPGIGVVVPRAGAGPPCRAVVGARQ